MIFGKSGGSRNDYDRVNQKGLTSFALKMSRMISEDPFIGRTTIVDKELVSFLDNPSLKVRKDALFVNHTPLLPEMVENAAAVPPALRMGPAKKAARYSLPSLLFFQIVFGVLIGGLSSFFAVRRYLHN